MESKVVFGAPCTWTNPMQHLFSFAESAGGSSADMFSPRGERALTTGFADGKHDPVVAEQVVHFTDDQILHKPWTCFWTEGI